MNSASIWIDPTDFGREGADAIVAAVKARGLRELSLAAKSAPKPGEKELARAARDAAVKAGLTVNAWVVGSQRGQLGGANCFGDRFSSGLCPSDPAARAAAVALACEAAARLEPAALDLEAFGFMGCADPKLDGAHGFLLSFCCCEHCSARLAVRKVEMKSLAEKACKLVQRFRDQGVPAAGAAPLSKPEEIGPWLARELGGKECAALLSIRREAVVELLQEIRQRVPKRVKLHAMAHPSPFVTGAAIGGGLLALDPIVDAFILELFHADATRMRAEVLSARTAAKPTTKFFANLRAGGPDGEGATAVLAAGAVGLRVA